MLYLLGLCLKNIGLTLLIRELSLILDFGKGSQVAANANQDDNFAGLF